jgi:uncharacterized LabA/DUF88 family protein
VAKPKTIVYVDGFNLYYGCLKGSPYKWLDLGALCARLLPKDDIKQIRYFTARVTARPPDDQQPIRQQAYLRALKTIPNLSIHVGQFRTRPALMPLLKPTRRRKMVWVNKTEEKGSDVNLASYLLFDAFRKNCQVAVVISNDADLREPVAMAQREAGIAVGVVNPHPPEKRSRDLQPTFFKQIRKSALSACQFPETLTDAQGAIVRPSIWGGTP